MLFNSYSFIFLYLPVTLAGFFWFGRRRRFEAAIAWLTIASLFFYAWWNPRFVFLILASILFNYLVGVRLGRAAEKRRPRKGLLAAGIGVNLAVLGYFKYAHFFVNSVGDAFGFSWHLPAILLPLGISFFTFTQIAYLVDAHKGITKEYSLWHYGLFVTFFPHLVAGPILHHKDLIPQFSKPSITRASAEHFASGSAFFIIGLFKKVILADSVAHYAAPAFSAAAAGVPVTFFDAWFGALAYTFQLYFDFSGYSDMAVGLGLLMGVTLPLNFNSPYKSASIAEFWKRWHMTLSRFLRDYLYVPLGGNRKGTARRYLNLMLTMLLGGLWHGAGWTFVVWGILHGAYLCVYHAFVALRRKLGRALWPAGVWGSAAGKLLTFFAVVFGWVIFRAENMRTARALIGAMLGKNGAVIPETYGIFLEKWGMAFSRHGMRCEYSVLWPGLGGLLFLSSLWGIAWFFPNTQEIVRERREGLRWKPRWTWSLGLGLMAALGIAGLSQVSEFLYFQF